MWMMNFMDWLFGARPIFVHDDSGIARAQAKYMYGDYLRDKETGQTYTVLSSCVSTSRHKLPEWAKNTGRSYLLTNQRYASTLFALPFDLVESDQFEALELARRPKTKPEKSDEVS